MLEPDSLTADGTQQSLTHALKARAAKAAYAS
jgi:hypothetical protein